MILWRRLALLLATLLVVVGIASPAAAAITFKQSATSTLQPSSANTVTVALSGVGAGNLIVTWCAALGTAAITSFVVDDGTSTFTSGTINNNGMNGAFGYLLSSNSGSRTYTCTLSASIGFRQLHVWEFATNGATVVLDTQNTANGVSAAPSSGTITTAGTDEVVIGAVAPDLSPVSGPLINGVAADGSLDLAGSNVAASWYRILAATFAGGSADATLDSSVFWISSIIAFRAASSDATPPSDPSTLVASATTSNQVALTWTGSTDNVAVDHYTVERCAGISCTSFAAVASPTVTNYSDSSLAANTAYRYRVAASDTSTNASGFSNLATATTLNTRSVTLNWQDNATTEDGFSIRRCVTTDPTCVPQTVYATATTNNINYVDTTSGQPVSCYDLQATLAGTGGSAFSNVGCSVRTGSTASLTITNAGTGSGTTNPTGTTTYATGTVVNLTATPSVTSDFISWGGAADCSDGSVTLTATTTCTATFNTQTGQFAYVGNKGIANNKVSGLTIGVVPTATISKGNLLIVRSVSDNAATASSTSGEHTVTDSLGNQYVRISEHTGSGGAPNAGVTVSIFASRPFASINATNTITLTLGSARVAKAIALEEFILPASVTFTNATSVSTNGTSTTPSAVISALSSAYRLFVGLTGIEADSSATPTQSNNYASGTTVNGTTGGLTTTNVASHFGFRRITSTGDTFAPTLPASSDWAQILTAVGTTTETNTYIATTTTTGAGGGTVTAGARYYGNSIVRIEATPDASSTFSGWATIAGNTCTSVTNTVVFFTLTQNTECRATFDAVTPPPTTFTLTLASAGTGSGTTSGGGVYNSGTVVGISANPAVGSFFAGWTPGVCSTGSVTMTADITCTATFTLLPTYTMTTGTTGSGQGSAAGTGTYAQGAIAVIIATPQQGSAFVGWSGTAGCIASSSTLNVLMDANKTCTATFASQQNPPTGFLAPSSANRCTAHLIANVTASIGVAEVLWRVDGVVLLSQTVAPYRFYKTLLFDGTQITADVRDVGGQVTTLGPYTVACP